MPDKSLLDTLPIEQIKLDIDGQRWLVHAVRDQNALLAASAQLLQMPFGLLLWESAIALAHWMAQQQEKLQGKRILELGAGVGLPGLIAARYGGEVWQTDHDPLALELSVFNASLNLDGNEQTRIQRFLADWRTWQHTACYDLIIGSDILYEREWYDVLGEIFQKNLSPGGKVILSDPGRPQALACIAGLEQQGWHFSMQQMQAEPPAITGKGRGVEVTLWEGARVWDKRVQKVREQEKDVEKISGYKSS